jgi:hypothetical protein
MVGKSCTLHVKEALAMLGPYLSGSELLMFLCFHIRTEDLSIRYCKCRIDPRIYPLH